MSNKKEEVQKKMKLLTGNKLQQKLNKLGYKTDGEDWDKKEVE